MKRSIVLFLAALAALAAISCRSPLETEEAAKSAVRIAFSFPGSSSSRTVVPDYRLEFDRIEVSMTSNNGYPAPDPVVLTAAPWVAPFEVPAGNWDIEVITWMGTKQTGTGQLENHPVLVGVNDPITINIDFAITTATTGGVNFNLSFPDETGIDYVLGSVAGQPDQTPTPSSDGTRSTVNFVYPALTPGTHSLVLTFRRGGAGGTAAGIFREKLLVAAGFTSATWVAADGDLEPERAFTTDEFFESNDDLFDLQMADILGINEFDSGTNLYTKDPIPDLGSSVSFTPYQSIAGQYIQYIWNTGSLTEIRSGDSSAALPLTEENTLTVRVTAPDKATTNDYVVTFSKGYRLTYNGNTNTGGTAPTDTGVYRSTEAATAATPALTFVKTGWTFIDWAEAAGGGGTRYKPGDPIPMNTGDRTLYARWIQNGTVNVGFSFNPEYGAIVFSPTTQTVARGTTLELGPSVVTPTGTSVATGWQWYRENALDATQTTETYNWAIPANQQPGQYIINVDALYDGRPCTGSIRVTVTY